MRYFCVEAAVSKLDCSLYLSLPSATLYLHCMAVLVSGRMS